jgi:CxxC-x17-CxxC domain-containing protein
MSPSQIIGFQDKETEKVEQKIKQEIADKNREAAGHEAKIASSAEVISKKEASPSVQVEVAKEKNAVKTEQPPGGAPKPPTVWHESVCDRCGKNTKVPFLPEEGRGVFCKECLREIRRQRALTVKDQKEKKIQAPVQHHSSTKTKPRVSEEQKEKLKEDLREMLQKIQAEK